MQSNNNLQDVYKVILVGDQSVGKSSILMRYTQNIFKREYTVTIGLEFASKKIMVQDSSLTLQIWDTAGQEAFRSIVRSFYRNSAAIIIVYKVTCRDTFESVKSWISEIQENGDEGVLLCIVGNMIDLKEDRRVTTAEGEALAQNYSALFFETSAQDGINIDEIFQKTLEKAYQNPRTQSTNVRDSVVLRSKSVSKENEVIQQYIPPTKKEKKGCC